MNKIHPTAEVSAKAVLGDGTSVWNQAQVRENSKIGKKCVIGKNVYVDFGVEIGDNCKVQNNCSVYHGSKIGNGVFLGPHCILTNDKNPRAVNPDGSLKGNDDWNVASVRIKDGAALGAGTIITPGVIIGEWAMTGSGSVVTKNVPPHALVMGNPARVRGFVCKCGLKLKFRGKDARHAKMFCEKCDTETLIPTTDYEMMKP